MVSRDADEGVSEGIPSRRSRAVMTNGGQSALSAIFDCLSDSQRRQILYYLRQRDAATVEELARYVVATETDQQPKEVDADECGTVKTALHHVHLPKLVDALIAEYDPRSSTVRYSSPPDELEPFLDFAERIEREEGSFEREEEPFERDSPCSAGVDSDGTDAEGDGNCGSDP